jgi:hypothetical protein
MSSIRHSIVASIPACHAGDRGSIPRVGELLLHNKSIADGDHLEILRQIGGLEITRVLTCQLESQLWHLLWEIKNL